MTHTSRTLAFSFLIAAAGLSGCDRKSDPSPENYKVAIQKALDARPAVCVSSPADAFPFDEPIGSGWGIDNYKRASALASAGLLTAAKTKVPLQVDKSVTVDGGHFDLTEEGRKYVRPAEAAVDTPAFCGGKKKLRDITSSTAPVGDGIGSQVLVVYSYDVVDAPAWAASLALKKVYVPELQPVSQTMNTQARLELTRDGWIAAQ